MAELARLGRGRFHRRRPADRAAPGPAPRAPVPAAAGGTIALHEEDPELSGDGVMHEGEVSAALGLAGIPAVSESTMIARDCSLAVYEEAPDPRPAPLRPRLGRGDRRGEGGRGRRSPARRLRII